MRCLKRNVVRTPQEFARFPLLTEAQIAANTCDLSLDDSKPSGVSHAPTPLKIRNVPEA
jgi:hypothetical protein